MSPPDKTKTLSLCLLHRIFRFSIEYSTCILFIYNLITLKVQQDINNKIAYTPTEKKPESNNETTELYLYI